MRIVKDYLINNILALMIMIFIPLLYDFVLYLNGVDLLITRYITFVIWVVFISVLIIRFYFYKNRYLKLEKQISMIRGNIDLLPKPHQGIESLYDENIRALNSAKNEQANLFLTKQRDLIDYYTLWVHQIKTPITALRLMLENNDEKNELFKIEQYTDMALTYLRMESMNSDLDLKEVSLDEMIKSTIIKYKKLFIASKLELKFEETNINLVTDEKWFSFVLEQIISNALKYTKTGYIAIYYANDALFIKDSGIGIDASDLPRIFERGFTGINGRRDKLASGLGLYMVKTILNKLGYDIKANSVVGEGTTFIINLEQKRIEKD